MKKILVTGGAGFIGSTLVKILIRERGFSVVNLDKLTYAACRDSLSDVAGNAHYALAQMDIADGTAARELLRREQPDAIIHLAAESHVDRSIEGPAEFIHTNIVGTFSLLEAARTYWKDLPENRKATFRFLHISTDEVFGSLGPDGAFSENSIYDPHSPYSASKASSDHLVRAWYHTYGLPVMITNCTNNYGPCQFPEKLIPLVILNALAGRPLPVYGKGANVRDWLYVEDHAHAILRVLEAGLPGETYCIGGESERSNIEVVSSICHLMDELAPKKEPHESLITYVQDRPGHDARYAMDISKIRRELSWQPQLKFEAGLRLTVQWYLNNRAWWERIQSGVYRGERLGLGAKT